MIKIYITFGSACKSRYLDAKRIAQYFEKNGCVLLNTPENADYIIFITCAFHKYHINESVNIIKFLSRYPGELIVGGCISVIDRNTLNTVFKGKSFSTLTMNYLDRYFKDFKYKITDIPDKDYKKNLQPFYYYKRLKRNKYYANYSSIHNFYIKMSGYLLNKCFWFLDLFPRIKFKLVNYIKKLYSRLKRRSDEYILRIGYGCNQKCTYCTHRLSIGKSKDKEYLQCLREFKEAINAGYTHIILTALSLGEYGNNTKYNFPKLLNDMIQYKGDYKISLCEFGVIWFIKYFQEIKRCIMINKIYKITIDIQSASKRILKLMNRKIDIKKLKFMLIELKKEYPLLYLGTSIIIGFPTETEKDFQETINFIKDVCFDYVWLFSYYENTHIKSKEIFPKVPIETINKRIHKAEHFLKKNKISFCSYPALI